MPLPPLARPSGGCRSSADAMCWGLAPWRGRTTGSAGPVDALAAPHGAPATAQQDPSQGWGGSSQEVPRWVFMPPSAPPAGTRVKADSGTDPGDPPATAGERVIPDRTGCWAFSLPSLCARTQEQP
ncbi:hypothetical protein GCM10010156_36960 [Planobispora rosea]|uniref:Uncharacterized protein n=1 Tax=Planobispora rosea TaxID=35762 RepID=A0A8J3RX26_PLARO|nr:hypothetical protein GCM10010156_36960 [Planobispora rosea]GIH81771.1 hypothetical protein Pro02_01790 [Planobispora rosea]